MLRPLLRRAGPLSHVGGFSRPRRPSSMQRRLDARISAFEACSGFTHVAARTFAGPPKAGVCPQGFDGSVIFPIARVVPTPPWAGVSPAALTCPFTAHFASPLRTSRRLTVAFDAASAGRTRPSSGRCAPPRHLGRPQAWRTSRSRLWSRVLANFITRHRRLLTVPDGVSGRDTRLCDGTTGSNPTGRASR